MPSKLHPAIVKYWELLRTYGSRCNSMTICYKAFTLLGWLESEIEFSLQMNWPFNYYDRIR
jgi:hypothetical protein